MLYVWLAVLSVLVIVLMLTDSKQIKKAACSAGGLVIAISAFVHFFQECTFTGPVISLAGCTVAVIGMTALTVYLFVKK
ncbi:MAG: hypothetical protein IKE91_02215 [Clostridia bacterium]|nr:hypothetical protein [Clostridia bacterium]